MLALTWDDGPDEGTLRLATYLAAHHVSATFFVVDEWVPGLSEEPGQGICPFETGATNLPVLAELVALGHRLGNHTAHHVLLAPASPATIGSELAEDQARLAPFLTNELRLFRVPGGAWDDAAGEVVAHDPTLSGLVGPVRWDVDGKDWEGSLFCRSDNPRIECEPGAPGHAQRVRAEVTARRYLAQVEAARHGIVLFHDRVGDVGSDYALRVAARVVPALEAEGYVFAAPVLELGAFRARLADDATMAWLASLSPATVVFADVDGDGRADLCGLAPGGAACARSVERRTEQGGVETVFQRGADAPLAAVTVPARRTEGLRGDLNGDGRVDTCTLTEEGLRCALEGGAGALQPSTWLARSRPDAAPLAGTLSMADVNGDGRADLCSVNRMAGSVACALAP